MNYTQTDSFNREYGLEYNTFKYHRPPEYVKPILEGPSSFHANKYPAVNEAWQAVIEQYEAYKLVSILGGCGGKQC